LRLDAYLTRIGITDRPRPDIQGLRTLQRAQRTSIAFENFDIPLGKRIDLDPDAVFEKLVMRKRGGYCFEQNQLLGRVFTEIGFNTRPLLGRVWVMPSPNSVPSDVIPPRTHTFACVELDHELWIADAGFGRGYAPPIRLVDQETVVGEDGTTHRLRTDAVHGWILEQWREDEWHPQYSFTLDMVADSDLEMSNHWTSTSPHSRFVQNQIASLILPEGVYSILGRSAAHIHRGKAQIHDITDAGEMQTILHDRLNIALTHEEVETIWAFNPA
jgi:N-hydroxyarylamine O-acetyltransferase